MLQRSHGMISCFAICRIKELKNKDTRCNAKTQSNYSLLWHFANKLQCVDERPCGVCSPFMLPKAGAALNQYIQVVLYILKQKRVRTAPYSLYFKLCSTIILNS
jgi:hypothetical protein